jgi:hypothetical protein
LRTRAWSLDSHLHSSHIILWGDQTAAKSYGKLQKRFFTSLLQFIYLTKRDTNLEKALRSGCFFELLGQFSIQRKVLHF